MSLTDTTGARIARWWVHALTRTAEPTAGRDRRDEIASDVHEQLAEASGRGALAAGSRSVVGRVVRGVPADLVWRIRLEARPGRLAWHLRNPSTALTSAFLVMVPVNQMADAAWPGERHLVDYRVPLWAATEALGVALLAFVLWAAWARVRPGAVASAQKYPSRSRAERLRRAATAFMAVSWAGSAVFRFGFVEPIGAVCWGLFWLGLLLYLVVLAGSAAQRGLTMGRYLPKVVA
ncbi:hypothetical protein [Nocardioides zhouii]|uniref:Uncharacterized protein n=1 Tax=Nocardioides zhouii TaxID=1168729 RepID=A0A4Q2TBE9_9ACTN|nr:hypothetical protein [Nocardioides zhouii]RYC14590.1 hypothetical protein EUA94_00240 [Nocardioides zhouii]